MESKPLGEFPLSNPGKTTNSEDLTSLSGDRENHQLNNNNNPKDKPLYEIADFEEAWKVYLASEEEWKEVYRRLADS